MVRMLYWWRKDFPHPFREAVKGGPRMKKMESLIWVPFFKVPALPLTIRRIILSPDNSKRLKVKWTIAWKSRKYPRALMNHRVRSMRLKTLLSISISHPIL